MGKKCDQQSKFYHIVSNRIINPHIPPYKENSFDFQLLRNAGTETNSQCVHDNLN